MQLNEIKKYIHLIEAVKEGNAIQYLKGHADTLNTPNAEWHDMSQSHSFIFEPEYYRIKPQPKLRPWKPEEVPVGAIVKTKDDKIFSRLMIVYVCDKPDEATLSTRASQYDKMIGMNVSMEYLLETYTHSTDGGKTWKSCGVEE